MKPTHLLLALTATLGTAALAYAFPDMKKLLSLIPFVLVALFATGCASTGGKHGLAINSVLDAALPADFTGPAHLEHKNPYFDFTIDAGGLWHDAAGWHWTWLKYKRSGRFSNGVVEIGIPPK